MIKIVSGDIRTAKENYIVQQVNCQGAMGSGVAKAIYTKWPRVRKVYKEFCSQYDPAMLLGQVLYISANDYNTKLSDRYPIIVNCFAQLDYRRKNDVSEKCYTNYAAFLKCMKKIEQDLKSSPIAMPYNIGCGLAGGDWGVIFDLLKRVFDDKDHTLILYRKDE